MSDTTVERVIEAGGGVASLSRALGLKHTSIIGWRRRNQVPVERVAEVARITGLSPHAIRPDLSDLFPQQPAKVA